MAEKSLIRIIAESLGQGTLSALAGGVAQSLLADQKYLEAASSPYVITFAAGVTLSGLYNKYRANRDY